MTQTSFLDPGYSKSRSEAIERHDEGIASRNETYQEIMPELNERCARRLSLIKAAGTRDITLDELSEATGLKPNKFSGRITELKKLGLVRHTSDRRKTRAGSTASVILAVAKTGRTGD